MNKKIKVTSVAAAALASLVLANVNLNNEVKADTKPLLRHKLLKKLLKLILIVRRRTLRLNKVM